MEKVYACIDLKSFYASVECVERNLNPLKTNLVVADKTRTEKTICLAISPALKKYGLGGRARLFEVIEKVKEINKERLKESKLKKLIGKSTNEDELEKDKKKALDFIIAPPRMSLYMKYSANIYHIYLKYIAKEDIHVYSIDEIFCDITKYLKYQKETAVNFITKIIEDIYKQTGITATAGIGTNLFLAKVAMDVVAKHIEANEYGVRIAELNEETYKKILWNYEPLTDIWRIGQGTAKRLQQYGIKTLGDIAKCSLENEELLYQLFGINAELLIDHAWGYEPCTIEMIKNYKPTTKCLSQSQVLEYPHDYDQTKLIIREMGEILALELTEKKLVTSQLVLTIGYDKENVETGYQGQMTIDHYGRKIPKHAHGSIHLDYQTSSTKIIRENLVKLYERITNKNLLIRRIHITAVKVEEKRKEKKEYIQLNIFSSLQNQNKEIELVKKEENEEVNLQTTVLEIKKRYGKNSILKGMNLEEGATTIKRNHQIGGHHE